MKYLITAIAAAALATSAHAATNDFDQAGDTAGATVDRYAPATFQSGVAYAGHAGTLVEGTSAADGLNNRSAPYQSAFYNTQGMAFATEAGATSASIELYFPADWTSASDGRYAGFWGVGYDPAQVPPDGPVVAYPIIEGYRVGGVDSFRGYNAFTGAWIDMGPATYGWNTLSIELLTGTDQFRYTVNGASETFSPANGSKTISSTILQVYNTTDGVTYDAHWDNLTSGAVPEPATWAMMIVGFGLAGATLRRRSARVA
jgi:hypothetical protein